MAILEQEISEEVQKQVDSFVKKIDDDMHFESDFTGDLISFEWLDKIEEACPHLDVVVRRPKLTLIQEENVVKIEKSKRITVASIKDLSRHTNYISKHNKETDEIEPSKILDIRNEETFNIYENRFLYTLIDLMNRFIIKKEDDLKQFEINDEKTLEYIGDTVIGNEKVNIKLKITSIKENNGNSGNLKEQLEHAKLRIKRVKEYITSWQRSEMYSSLEKAHIPLVQPPIKKTNIILKNPHFQLAVKLWDFLQKYDYTDRENSEDNLDSNGNDVLRGFLNHSFLIDYFVLNSISKTRREEKEKMSQYAIIMLTQEIYRTISLLRSCGIKIDDEELLGIIAKEIKNEKSSRLIGADDVKKKFKSAMTEYMERIQDYL